MTKKFKNIGSKISAAGKTVIDKIPKESITKFTKASKEFAGDVVDASCFATKAWFSRMIDNKLSREANKKEVHF